jgi:hypothetical protein
MTGKIETAVLKEIREAGYRYRSVDQIFKVNSLEPKVVQIILHHLPALYQEDVAAADTLVRSLISAAEPFDPTNLIDLYDKGGFHHYLKIGIAHALAYGKTSDISSWLRHRLASKELDTGNYGLIGGLQGKGGFKNVREMMDFSKRIFDLYPTLDLFKKYGDDDDYLFLEEKAKTADPALAKKIKKLLDKKKLK